MIKALVAVRGMTEESAKIFIEDQTRNFTNTTEEFGKIVNAYCEKHNSRVIFLMDEVGQFIGDNTQLMLNLQTCVEDLGNSLMVKLGGYHFPAGIKGHDRQH